ncbi:MAG: lipoate--protein ligase family protein [Anaerolineaceae bacterium]|nr:lipoate--protein ligase family protein [Anaerolineaceae bacterium]
MAKDEAILTAVSAGDAPPTLRLYAWEPMCLSLGYGQRGREADIDRLAAIGWEIVRRPTGGKAILHGDELTYSLALPTDHPLAAGDVVTSYLTISRALVAGLELLGLRPQADPLAAALKIQGPVCFEVPSHYEITANGRKLIGSAQVRRKGGILQHGTLPLYGDLGRICTALDYPDEASREAGREQVRARAITLEAALGRRVAWQTAADALVQGFVQTFDLDFTIDTFTPDEQADAERLQAIYGRPEHYLRR